MSQKIRKYGVAGVVALIFLMFFIDTGLKAYAQTQKKNEIKEEETFHRPQPTQPTQPQVPGVNRYQDDKVFLEYADSLYKQYNRRDTTEKQILKGNVKFRQAGLWMYCDSAYYYPNQNSLDAFSNVRMEQGDTLFVYADQLFYEGNEHLAKLKNGPTERKVKLINKDVTLITDSLDYDMNIELGWYTRWGTLDDKVNTLTSLYGEYSPRTKKAQFFHDVELVNNRDGFTMLTDTLYYSTETHIAEIESRTIIQGANDTIITNYATYYTDTGDADLLSRSMIIHRDSTGNIITLEGDSIIYDNTTRISRAYMFKDPFKHSAPMVITDTAQKTTLIGGFGIYNDSTKEALATIYPLLMEYSQGDTLFLRADTIKTFIVTEMVPDKRRKTKSGFPEFNGEPIVKADSTGIWIDTTFFVVKIPYADSPITMLMEKMMADKRASTKKEKPSDKPKTESQPTAQIDLSQGDIAFLDSLAHEIIPDVEEALELIPDGAGENREIEEVAQKDISEKNPVLIEAPPQIEISGNREISPTDTIDIDMLVPDSIPMEYHVALAYPRGRFFKQDMQGVADSMVFVERDSMLYMFRKPIVWSGERQVTGNRIDVHFNDSTTDWAYLPEFGLMSEHVEEDFYNQIFGKEIKAWFENQGLRRMEVSGNVETIFLPQEEDSTYNRLVEAESSYMDAYLSENKLEKLKMWPEVSGTVTPLFLVKRTQMYLQKFRWWDFLRPQREWYGDRWKWADNLGEVPEELEKYFLSPSDFSEPKSFSGTRFTPPPTSLPMADVARELNTLDSIQNIENESQLDFMQLSDSIPSANAITPLDSVSQPDSISENITLGEIENLEQKESTEAEATEKMGENIEEAVENDDPETIMPEREPAKLESTELDPIDILSTQEETVEDSTEILSEPDDSPRETIKEKEGNE